MARKRRASIRGRGAEILFGTPESEEPQPPEGRSAAPESARESAPLEDLFPGEPDGSTASPPESAPVSEATPDQPAQPPAEEPAEEAGPVSNGELYRDWRRTELGMATDSDPSPGTPRPIGPAATPDTSTPAGERPGTPVTPTSPVPLSPEEARELAKAVTAIRSLLPDIGMPEEHPEDIVTHPLPVEDLKRARQRVTRAMITELDKEIDNLYALARREVSSNRHIANRCLRLLHEARQILLVQPGRYADAELKIEQVRIILKQADNSEKAAHTSARLIFLYNVGWFLGLLILLIVDQALANWLKDGPLHMLPLFSTGLKTSDGTTLNFSMIYYFLPWFCMLWGGIGGVVGSLYSLRWYVSRRQYDVEHNLSYLAHPIMGIILGGVVYFLFRTGFFALQAVQANIGTLEATQQILTAQSPVLLLVSVLAGFKQKFVYEMLDRVMRAILRVQVEGEPNMTEHEPPLGLEDVSSSAPGSGNE